MEFWLIYLFKFKLIGKYSFGISFDTYNTKFVPENTPCLLLAISRHQQIAISLKIDILENFYAVAISWWKGYNFYDLVLDMKIEERWLDDKIICI